MYALSKNTRLEPATSFRNLARSIREKATDMALGFVQPTRDLATTTPKHTDINSPRHFFRYGQTPQVSCAVKRPIKLKLDIVLDTPVLVLPRSSCSSQVFVAHLGKISFSNNSIDDQPPPSQSTPKVNKMFTIDEEMFLIGEQPVSLPGEYASTNIYLSEDDLLSNVEGEANLRDSYVMDVRNMNLYSLDTKSRKGFRL